MIILTDETDDHILAQPLNDTSSFEVNEFHQKSSIVNSTPLLYNSPSTRNRYFFPYRLIKNYSTVLGGD